MTTTVDLDRPRLVHVGPAEFSTSTALEQVYLPRADVNGYYRELGVSPYATKVQLRQAYQRLNGHESPRLTYVLHQLLNPGIRAQYDAKQIGSIFVDDYVRDFFKAELIRREPENFTARMNALNELDEPEPEVFDSDPALGLTRAHTAAPRPFPYGFYLLCLSTGDESLLQRWQAILIAAARRKGLNTRLSIGLHGANDSPWMSLSVGYRQVLFLNHLHEPTTEDADNAIRTILPISGH